MVTSVEPCQLRIQSPFCGRTSNRQTVTVLPKHSLFPLVSRLYTTVHDCTRLYTTVQAQIVGNDINYGLVGSESETCIAPLSSLIDF